MKRKSIIFLYPLFFLIFFSCEDMSVMNKESGSLIDIQ